MPDRVRLVAATGLACLLAGVLASVLLPQTTARSAPSSRVVVLGDSVGTDSGCGCLPFGPRLAQLLSDHRGTAVRVDDRAQDGQTSSGLADQLTSDRQTIREVHSADAVVVVIGANDFDSDSARTSCEGAGTACFDSALAALPASLDTSLTRIRSLAGPKVQILVLGYWNVFLDGAVGAQQGATYQRTSAALTRRVDDVIQQRAARAGATYVDLYSAFRRQTHGGDDTTLLAPDGDHPSERGHQLIAEVLAGYLDDVSAR